MPNLPCFDWGRALPVPFSNVLGFGIAGPGIFCWVRTIEGGAETWQKPVRG